MTPNILLKWKTVSSLLLRVGIIGIALNAAACGGDNACENPLAYASGKCEGPAAKEFDLEQGVEPFTVLAVAKTGGTISPARLEVDPGETATFTVKAEPGYSIGKVTGCEGSVKGDQYTTGPVTADCTVTAAFTVLTYTVTASAGANGSITPPTSEVDHSKTAVFTITPDTGYHIASADGCAGTLSGNTYTTGQVTAPCAVTVAFAINVYTVGAAAGAGGAIAPASRSVFHGATTDFTVTPSTGYSIGTVTGCGGTLSGNTFTTGTVTADCQVTAAFSLNRYTVTASAGANGAISPASGLVYHGSTTSFTVTPAVGYHIDTISGCSGSLSGNTYTTAAVTGPCAVAVTFAINTYTVNATGNSGGTISPASQTIAHFATAAFTVTPDTGYHIVSVTGCGGALSGSTYTTGAISGACTVTAAFAINTYTVTGTAGAGGAVSPASTVVNHGSTTALTVTPDTGYHITSVTGCGGALSGNTYTTGAVTAACTVTASFAVNSYTLTASAGAGGTISPASTTSDHFSTATFTVTPDTGYSIASVTGCGGSLSENTYTTGTITGACTVTASFSLNAYTISASAGLNGAISPASATVYHFATTTFTLAPDSGYHIDSVTGCGGSLSGNTYTTGTISGPCTVLATFALNTYTVSTSAGLGGSFSPASATVAHGDFTDFTVTPATGYSLDTVSGCGGTLIGNTYTTGTITAACTVTATFTLNTYTVTAAAGLNGSISPATRTVSHGSTTTFTVTPDTNYDIDGVSGCGGTLSGTTYTTGTITGPCAVTATFVLKSYTVTASAGTGGSVSPTSAVVSHGDMTDFTVVPDTGYNIASVTGCGGTLAGGTYSTGAVTGACTVTATFSLKSYTVSTSAGSGGSIAPTSSSVTHGATTSFTVTPSTGYNIASVTGCGGSLSGSTYTTGTITGACTVTASFSLKTYTVSTSAGAGGSISPTSSSVNHGSTTSFTVTPSTGYSLGSVSGCGGTLSGNTYTTGAITAACTVSATFNVVTYTVTATAGSGGNVSPASRTVNHGATTTFSILASSGYAIASVTGCGGTLSGTTYTTGAITAACTVSASFNSVNTMYDFSNLGTASGGFKPQGDRFLVSSQFTNDGTLMYYDNGGVAAVTGALIKADGVNLQSFDLVDMQFSGYINETMTMTVTATLAGGGTVSQTITGKSLPAGVKKSLVSDLGMSLAGFNDVTQLSFDFSAGEGWNVSFETITIGDQKAPPVAGVTPTIQASALQVSSVSGDQIGLRWTNGNGSKRIVFMQQGSTGAPTVVDGTSYPATSVFTAAMDIGGGWRPVYKGTGTSVIVTGLSATTAYRAVVFEYDGQGGGEKYLTTVGTNALNKSTVGNFATWSSGSVRTLLSKNFWTWPSAAIGADGNSYVVHYDYDSDSEAAKRVVVSKWNGTSWSTHASFLAADAGLSGFSDYLSVAVDSSNAVHIALMGYIGSGVTSNRGIVYAKYNGSWLFENVELNSHPSGWLNTSKPVITVDSSNVPYIVFELSDASTSTQYMKLATRTGANTWTKDVWSAVSSSGSTQVREWALKADSAGKLHLVYVQGPSTGDRNLRYRTNASGSWVDTLLTTNSETMQWISLVTDGSNKVHVAFAKNGPSYDTVYATNASGAWVFSTLNGSSAFGPWEIRINAGGDMVIAVEDGSTIRLLYKAAASSEWLLSNASASNADKEGYFGMTFSNDRKVMLTYANDLASRPRTISYALATLAP